MKTREEVSVFVEAQFAGYDIAQAIASALGGVAPLRSYSQAQGVNPVIARSMLIARGWQDKYSTESSNYLYTIISDVLNNRQGVSDAVSQFVFRLQDLYTPQ